MFQLVELLLRHGANPLQVNSKGKTAVDIAANSDIVKLLKNEMIASSSSCSSIEHIHFPTSPESLISDKEEDRKINSQGNTLFGKILISIQKLNIRVLLAEAQLWRGHSALGIMYMM